LEREFYTKFITMLGLDESVFADAHFRPARANDPRWPQLKTLVAEAFRTRTQAEWCDLLEGSDICFAPVLAFSEASKHPHNVARNAYLEVAGVLQNAPAPRFDRTPAGAPRAAPLAGAHSREIMSELGINSEEFDALAARSVIT